MNRIYYQEYELFVLEEFPNYAASKCGKVFSLNYRNKRIIRPLVPGVINGYEYIYLWERRRSYRNAVHRLIAKLFIQNPENKAEVNHLNLNTRDNRIENLEWCTHAENMKHASTMGVMACNDKRREACRKTGSATGALNGKKSAYKRASLNIIQVREIKECLRNGYRQNMLAIKHGVSKQTINNIAHDKKQTYAAY